MSRTNRLFDERKKYGQIVTFQVPNRYKREIDNALKLFSTGDIGEALASDWDETESNFIIALTDLRALTPIPADAASLSPKEKRRFSRLFQRMDFIR